uniref:Uncharacterized protein n=1 Tax=Knipowitschia caucasica TaxID=637954 RepID=A0AAV2LH94_KNICA
MSGSGSGPGSDYDEGELVEPCEEDAQSSYSQEVGQRERYPLDRFSHLVTTVPHLTASAVVRMCMAMPVQPASPPVDYLQSLAPSPRRRRREVVAPRMEPLLHYASLQGGPSSSFDKPRWGPVCRWRVVWRGVGALGRGGLDTSAEGIGALGRGGLDPSAVCSTFLGFRCS